MFTKILYINSPQNDFLSDSFLIGLKELYGERVIEWPINNHIYKKEHQDPNVRLHGIGFTLYNLLETKSAVPYTKDMPISSFDLVIFGDIYRQSTQYLSIQNDLNYSNTLILDGEDTPAPYPFYFAPWKKPYSPIFPKLYKKHLYFKREIVPNRTNYYLSYKMVPKSLAGKIALPKNILPISFSIPSQKVVTELPQKTKLFGKHIVDEEVAKNVEGAMTKYAFSNEADYYADLQQSKFGITTKRGGWDCLRHYEIAANGAVMCFKKLHEKPNECAPHDLVDGINCINYEDYNDLITKITAISEQQYAALQRNSLDWVRSKTCDHLVAEILQNWKDRTQNSSTKSK
jgi:hypothetical protein